MSLIHPAWHRTHPKDPHKDPWMRAMQALISTIDPIQEAWQNWELWIVVVQNRNNGLWYFAPYNCHNRDLLRRHTRSKEWAMLLAQESCVGLYKPSDHDLVLERMTRSLSSKCGDNKNGGEAACHLARTP